MKQILVTGFPYVRDAYRETLDQLQNIKFLLPRTWSIKKGAVVFRPRPAANVRTTSALFTHSHYPVIGGALKGWMPLFPLRLLGMNVSTVYACSEPILLSTLWFGFWSKLFGKKLILFSWQNLPYRRTWIVRANLWLADALICGNHKGAEVHRALTAKPISVIPMSGVDTERFVPRPRLQKDVVTFLFAGAIGYRKGIHVILEAFKKIKNAKLIIVGSGEFEDQLEIPANVEKIAWVSHEKLVEIMQDADVFLYPSISHGGWEEQFGYSMAEASLMELPVIATRTGSIEEVVRDGETGILVEPENVDVLASAMQKLADDPALRVKLGKAGREYITANFAHEIIAEKFASCFREVEEAA